MEFSCIIAGSHPAKAGRFRKKSRESKLLEFIVALLGSGQYPKRKIENKKYEWLCLSKSEPSKVCRPKRYSGQLVGTTLEMEILERKNIFS